MAALKRSRNMVIDEGSGMTVGGIRAKILKYKPDVVFIDHCGLIVGEDARMSRLDVIANATNQLKAMAKEMGNKKYFWLALLFQNVLAYAVSLMVYQIGGVLCGEVTFGVATVVAILVLAAVLYLLFRPDPNKAKNRLTKVA